LQALIDKDPCQLQHELAQLLNVDRPTISAFGSYGKNLQRSKIDVIRTERKKHREAKSMSEILLARQKRKGFLHRIVTGDEKWIFR